MAQIREATLQDAAGCVAVVQALPEYFTADTHDEVRHALGTDPAWVAVDGDAIDGFVVARRRFPGAAEITFAAVTPDRRRAGIGTALVAQALDALATGGVGMVEVKTLDASAGYQPYLATRAFWDQLGFVQIDRIDPLPGWAAGNPAAILVRALPPSSPDAVTVRNYEPADEESWLRCRVLSFLHSDYYDNVLTAKPAYPGGLELVAVQAAGVVGIYDVSVDGTHAVLETLAVHPDDERRGVATRLQGRALDELRDRGVTSIEAWTRDSPAANAWYAGNGFTEGYRYRHVYASGAAQSRSAVEAAAGLVPIEVFLHAEPDHDPAELARFGRVYTARRYDLTIPAPEQTGRS